MEQIVDFIREKKLNIYDIAVMTEEGIKESYCQPCNACNDSYSVTKLFISSAIGVLLDKGLLRLDDKIMDILKDSLPSVYAPVWDQVTIRHAMTHRMGIDYGVIDIDRDEISDYETENFLEYILNYPPVYAPGKHYEYTDVPHYLLSRVISQITGLAADEIINKKLLLPLSFRQFAFSRCPQNYTIGGTGAFLKASDMVKLGWTYLNYGVYQKKRILSERFIQMAEQEGFSIEHINDSSFLGKTGMNGQIVMYSRERKIAVAWHGYEIEERDRILVPFFEELYG